jgi:hypothetical protein
MRTGRQEEGNEHISAFRQKYAKKNVKNEKSIRLYKILVEAAL